MIYVGTYMKPVDNSGAVIVKCIKILSKKSPSDPASIGDRILVAVRQAIPEYRQINKNNRKRKIKRGQIYPAIVLRKAGSTYHRGILYFDSTNSVILLKKNGRLLGTRILSLVPFFVLRQLRRARNPFLRDIIKLMPNKRPEKLKAYEKDDVYIKRV